MPAFLKAVAEFQATGTKLNATYVYDQETGLKLFGKTAFYVRQPSGDLCHLPPQRRGRAPMPEPKRQGGDVRGGREARRLRPRSSAIRCPVTCTVIDRHATSGSMRGHDRSVEGLRLLPARPVPEQGSARRSRRRAHRSVSAPYDQALRWPCACSPSLAARALALHDLQASTSTSASRTSPSPLRGRRRASPGHLGEGSFYVHILVSIRRIAIGYLLAGVLGIALGLVMGRSRFARDLVLPYIELLRPIPAVAWIPLAILMWPTEEASIIYITFLGALFPIVLNTIHGVEQTPEVLVRAAPVARRLAPQIFRHVVLPAALPSIVTGLAIAMGVSWFSLLAGEIISGQYGIGYFTWNAYSLIHYPDIVVGMLTIGLLGTRSTALVRRSPDPFWLGRATGAEAGAPRSFGVSPASLWPRSRSGFVAAYHAFLLGDPGHPLRATCRTTSRL